MDIGWDHDQHFVHLIHESPFLPPIYPQITPKIFCAFSSVLKNIFIPQAARKAQEKVPIPRRPRTKLMGIQACESLTDTQTRKREITALSEAMDELKIKSGTIVTRSGDERIKTDAGIINVIPAWRFLLDLPEIA